MMGTYGAGNASRRRRYAVRIHQQREEERRRRAREAEAARPRRNGTDVGTGPRCPQDPEHGHLLTWSGGGAYDLYCPHDGHAGMPFYRLVAGEAVKP